METKHVKIEYEEALTTKKELLNLELNLLQLVKKIKAYKTLRKKEFTLKNKIKTAFQGLKTKINSLLSTFPKEEKPKKKTYKIEKKDKKNLQEELNEIKRKLETLERV